MVGGDVWDLIGLLMIRYDEARWGNLVGKIRIDLDEAFWEGWSATSSRRWRGDWRQWRSGAGGEDLTGGSGMVVWDWWSSGDIAIRWYR